MQSPKKVSIKDKVKNFIKMIIVNKNSGYHAVAVLPPNKIKK